MKKVLKFIGFGFLTLIVLGVIGSFMSDGEETTETKEVSAPVKDEQKQETPKEKPTKKEDKGISKEEFDKLENGMSYEEAVEIIGVEGELISETGSKGDQFYTVMYQWDGESGFGANANAMFQGGKLESKAQFGLE